MRQEVQMTSKPPIDRLQVHGRAELQASSPARIPGWGRLFDEIYQWPKGVQLVSSTTPCIIYQMSHTWKMDGHSSLASQNSTRGNGVPMYRKPTVNCQCYIGN